MATCQVGKTHFSIHFLISNFSECFSLGKTGCNIRGITVLLLDLNKNFRILFQFLFGNLCLLKKGYHEQLFTGILQNSHRKPVRTITISDTSRNLVPFIQFNKLEKHPWRSVTFSKVAYTLPWVFFTFFKLCKMVPNHTKRLINVATFFYTELSGRMNVTDLFHTLVILIGIRISSCTKGVI